ncbi:M15 family metallopeptidase [Streptomyces sp. NBC_00239]|uniref:M15 family metallopeptidase n=1 Tax=Streptomyces sp. NBC_00239 TaxID=2903640 RepID=UPI002E2BC115|nr:M15 family metallopeptidase [Streptomyces sp. NBC_00239]
MTDHPPHPVPRPAPAGPPILMADPRVTAIPVTGSDEVLVDLRTRPYVRVDPRKADPYGHYAHVREDVARRLAHAAAMLPAGLAFLFVEGYRPPDLQQHYFTAYRDRLRDLRPDLDESALHLAASRYVSPPEIAPHSAGSAIDLTLCTEDGLELPMGTTVNASPEDSGLRCYTAAQDIDTQSRANRELLGSVLTAAGFVNYPTEWWHWSYGDRYWALSTGRDSAPYGPVLRDPDPSPPTGDGAVDEVAR